MAFDKQVNYLSDDIFWSRYFDAEKLMADALTVSIPSLGEGYTSDPIVQRTHLLSQIQKDLFVGQKQRKIR